MESDNNRLRQFNRRKALRYIGAAGVAGVAGCIGNDGSDDGDGGNGGDNGGGNGGNGGGGNGGGSEIGTEPTFTNVQQIFEQSCGGSSCHINQQSSGVQLNTYENVMNSQGTRYGELVVQAGDADGSPLVDKIEPNPEIGSRMPEGGPYLSDERINQIKDWIDNGAENN
jgi:hypothetical protein